MQPPTGAKTQAWQYAQQLPIYRSYPLASEVQRRRWKRQAGIQPCAASLQKGSDNSDVILLPSCMAAAHAGQKCMVAQMIMTRATCCHQHALHNRMPGQLRLCQSTVPLAAVMPPASASPSCRMRSMMCSACQNSGEARQGHRLGGAALQAAMAGCIEGAEGDDEHD